MRANEAIPLTIPDDSPVAAPETAALARAALRDDVGEITAAASSRPVNYKFLAFVTVIAIAGWLLFDLVHDRQMHRMAGLFLDRSHQARRAGDLKAATQNLRHYIRLVPEDVDARTDLAFTLTEIAETPRQHFDVFLMLEGILRDDSSRRDVRRKLAHLAMSFGRYSDAIVHLKLLLYSDANDHDSLTRLAQCFEEEGKPIEAEATYKAAIRTAPREFDNYERLATLLAERLSREQDAEQIMNQMVAGNRRAHQAYLSRARYWQNRGRLKQATADARRAYQLAPLVPDVLVLAANVLTSRSLTIERDGPLDANEVRSGLQRVLKQHPDDVQFIQALAQLDVLVDRSDLAEQRLRDGLAEQPDDRKLLWSLADVLSVRGKLDEARDMIVHLGELKLPPDLIAYLEARVAMAEGDWVGASRQLNSIRVRRLHGPTLYIRVNLNLAVCYRQLGHQERQLAAYRRVVDLNDVSPEGREGLAATLAQAGRIDDALLHYRQVMDRPGVPLTVARLLIARNLRLPPDERNWQEVERLLDRVGSFPRNLVDVLLLRADLSIAQDEREEAREMLERAVQRQSGQTRFWVALAALHRHNGHLEQAEQVLKSAEDKLGRRIEIHVARVQNATSLGPEHAPRELRKLESGRGSFSQEDQRWLVRALAVAYGQVDRPEVAKRLWTEVVTSNPNDLSAWRQLLQLALRSQSDDESLRCLAQIERIEGKDGIYWKLGEAGRRIMLARRGEPLQLDVGRQLLKDVADENKLMTEVSLRLAEVEELLGNEEGAIEHYQNAINRGESSAAVVYRVVQLLNKRQRYFDAEHVIRQFREQSIVPLGADLGRLAVQVSIRTRDFQQALTMARAAVSADSRNFRDHLWLGHVLWAAGRAKEAERSIRRGVELDRAQPEPWVALVYFLQRIGRGDDALAAIEEARTHWAPDQSEFMLAQCYEVLGRGELAKRHYESALKSEPENRRVVWNVARYYLGVGRPDKARPLLEQLLGEESADGESADGETDSSATAPFVQEARRALALMLVLDGGYQRYLEAMRLIEKNLERPGADADDLRIKAKLLATRPNRSLRREAIRILINLDERRGLTPADRFQLIRLFLAIGSWTEARETMTVLMSAHDGNPEYLAFCAGEALERGEVGGIVQQWLDALEKLRPDAFRTSQLRALSLLAGNDVDAALDVLDRFQNREAATPAVATHRQGQVAAALADMSRKLERQGKTILADRLAEEAEKQYREYIKKRPDKSLGLVRLLGQQWKFDKALEVCEQAWQSAAPELVAVACVELLQTGRASPQQVQHLRIRIQRALRDKPHSAELLFQLANVEQFRGDYEAAIDFYRQTIGVAPQSVAAHNELALLLALDQGDAREALKHINRAIELAGPLPRLLDTRATVYLILGRTSEAIDDLETAIADAPTPDKHFHLAQARLASHNAPAAKLAYQDGMEAGLHVDALHPLERTSFEQVHARLNQN